jgi:hypothetical protein
MGKTQEKIQNSRTDPIHVMILPLQRGVPFGVAHMLHILREAVMWEAVMMENRPSFVCPQVMFHFPHSLQL